MMTAAAPTTPSPPPPSTSSADQLNLFDCMEGSDFSAVDWVNQLVESSLASSSSEVDATAASSPEDVLINTVRSAQTRLQTRSQELSRDAERLMERLLSLGPRSLQELDRVERDSAALKQDLKRLQEESLASTASGTGPFHALKSLDIIKTNLERCVEVLQETGSWHVLVREMDAFFAARNLAEVASRLNTMKLSAQTLSVFPGGQDRQDMLERMEQRLESLVRPGLASALEQADADPEPLKQSVLVYTKLGRGDALLADVSASRGKLMFDECWKTTTTTQEEDAEQHKYARFTERVFTRVRLVDAPLCEYAFGGGGGGQQQEQVANALASILRACFDRITPAMLLTSPYVVNKTCERYVLAHLANDQFAQDLTNSVLRLASPALLAQCSKAIHRAFAELDGKYLEWEAAELIAQLQADIAKTTSTAASSSSLGPSQEDRMQLEMHPGDALDALTEACLSRCHRLKLSAGHVPICKMYAAHLANARVFGSKSTMEPRARLHTICQLKRRFVQCMGRLHLGDGDGGGEDDAVRVRRRLDALVAEAKSLLFDSFVRPALVLLDQASTGSGGGGDSITRVVDHLYSLIPRLEFEDCSRDYLADVHVLGRGERAELESVLGGVAIPFATTTATVAAASSALSEEEDEDVPRQVSASWLECIARALCTAFVLRVVRLKTISDELAASLGLEADMLEKNAGSVLSPGDKWDAALGVCRVVLSAEPGLTYLKLGNPVEYLDSRYWLPSEEEEQDAAAAAAAGLKTLEHILVGLRTRRVE